MQNPLKLLRRMAAIAALCTLAACGTVMTATPSGFLSHELSGAPARWHAGVAIDPARATLAPVQWRAGDAAGIDAAERQALLARLEADLRARLAELPPVDGGQPVVLRAAITRVEPVSPMLNTVATVLLIGPFDRGGAVVELEALDAADGRALAALRIGHYAPLAELKARFRKLAAAEVAIGQAAAEFAVLIGRTGARPAPGVQG
jgi:hypothetical protein